MFDSCFVSQLFLGKDIYSKNSTNLEICFNSTMVRLKDSPPPQCYHILSFQFHNGSIKGLESCLMNYFAAQFQFHNGSIKGTNDSEKIMCECRFNSTMVRLKAYPGLYVFTSIDSFNSTMVRLKVIPARKVRAGIFVSIPQWFD